MELQFADIKDIKDEIARLGRLNLKPDPIKMRIYMAPVCLILLFYLALALVIQVTSLEIPLTTVGIIVAVSIAVFYFSIEMIGRSRSYINRRNSLIRDLETALGARYTLEFLLRRELRRIEDESRDATHASSDDADQEPKDRFDQADVRVHRRAWGQLKNAQGIIAQHYDPTTSRSWQIFYGPCTRRLSPRPRKNAA